MCRVLVGEPEGRLLGRPEHQWVDNTRTGIEETGWKDLDIVSCTHYNEPLWFHKMWVFS
jgi:hypothetical protein